MNTNTKRMVLAAIAAFYVVVGGLWGSHYFPLNKYYAQMELQDALKEKHGYIEATASKEYKESRAYQQVYAMTKPGIFVTEKKIAFYQSILLWGTIALAAGGGVLFLTRGRKSQPAQTGAQ